MESCWLRLLLRATKNDTLLLEELIMWGYKQTEPFLYTVGFYDPDGRWHSDSDHGSKDEAAKRVHYLNGAAD
jgi:hypothetical protein